MAKVSVTLWLDEALVGRARSASADFSSVVERALRRHLEHGVENAAADRRWAEENALAVEALAGGAEETR